MKLRKEHKEVIKRLEERGVEIKIEEYTIMLRRAKKKVIIKRIFSRSQGYSIEIWLDNEFQSINYKTRLLDALEYCLSIFPAVSGPLIYFLT